jgi:hypothetical protein
MSKTEGFAINKYALPCAPQALAWRLLLLATLTAAACTHARTETVVFIDSSGLRVPDDIDRVHVVIADRGPTGDDSLFDQQIELCGAVQSPSCQNLPISMTLIPGSMRPHDTVKVSVEAERRQQVVIANVGLFTFSDDHSLRLDVILYASCLGNLFCATNDQACVNGQCVTLMAEPFSGETDLSALPPPDMSGKPPDMTSMPDLVRPLPDLAGVDLMGCVPQCPANTCAFNGCSAYCMCATTHVFCDPSQICAPCGTQAAACCPSSMMTTRPLPHAGTGGGGPTGFCDTGLVCNSGTCEMPMPDMAVPPPCGLLNQPCCTTGPPCTQGICNGGTNMCEMVVPPMDMLPFFG